jgi:hypothetical protein
VVSAANAAITRNQSVAASTLFSVSDADSDAITEYEFWDSGAAASSGHFTVNGITQGANQTIAVSSATLAQTRYVGGDAPGAETVWVRANDGSEWSAWQSWAMTTQGSAPVASAANRSVHVNQSLAASTLFSVSDADNNAITQYEFWDSGAAPSSGHFAVSGAAQGSNQAIPVNAANLGQLTYVSGSVTGSETVWVRADDGTGFSAWVSWTMSTGNAAPVVSAANGSVLKGQSVAASSLFSVSDSESDAITQYEFWDSGAAATSGHFTVGGATRPANTSILIPAANLGQVNYVGGSAGGAETLWVRANDGSDWSDWKSWTMTTQDRIPVVSAGDGVQHWGAAVAASTLFSVTDPDGDGITKYEFWDSGTASSSGYFAIDGQRQSANAAIPVTAANLSHVTYVAGTSAGPETVWVRANDGDAWSDWKSWTMTTQGNAPLATPTSAVSVVGSDMSVTASTLFSAADGDGDTITEYQFWDGGAGATSGHFTLNGATQPANQAITVSAANLAQLSYAGGSDPGMETVWVRASDGSGFGEWVSWNMDTRLRFNEVIGTSGADQFSNTLTDTAYFGVASNDNFQVNSGQDPFLLGGPGGDTYSLAFNDVNVLVLEDGNSAGDFIFTGGFGARPNSVAATIDNRHLLLADTDSNTVIIVIDWQKPENRIESWALAGVPVPFTYDQMVQAVTSANSPNLTWEQVGYSTAYFNEAISYYTQREAKIVNNHAPVVAATTAMVRTGNSIPLTSLFQASDADGDPIVRYELHMGFDSPVAGYITIAGVAHQEQVVLLEAADLAGARYVATSNIERTHGIQVRAYDGIAWGAQSQAIAAVTINHAPVIADPGNVYVQAGTASLVSTWLRAYDQDADALTQYQFMNSLSSEVGSPTGRFVLNGLAQPTNQWFTVDASQFDSLIYVAGNPAQPFEQIQAKVTDGQLWSDAPSFFTSFPQTLNRPPVLTLKNDVAAVVPGQSVAVSSWFDATEPDGTGITQYRFNDSSAAATSGYFTVNGNTQNPTFTISAAQLADTRFVAGQPDSSGAAYDSVMITALDGSLESASPSLTVIITSNRLPVVTASDSSVALNQSVLASSLFSAVDPDNGDQITRYTFIDFGDDPASGYFTLNGLRQTSGSYFQVDAQNLGMVRYVGGSAPGTEMVSVRASSFLTPNIEPAGFARFSVRSGNVTADGAGNDTAHAQPVTVGSNPSVFSDFVGDADSADYYQLNVGAPGDVILGLTQLAGNANLQLLDSTGNNVLASSLNLGTTSEGISQNLAAGTYYARVTPTGGDDTSYKLTALLAQL